MHTKISIFHVPTTSRNHTQPAKNTMEDSIATIVLASVLAILFLYKTYLSFTRDVPLEYLTQQSVVDSVRNPGELAIYKSTKLDYSSGLRVGFGIRYDSYKVRNGNLCDVWEIVMYALERNPDKKFTFDGESIGVAEVNGWAQLISKFLLENNVNALAVPLLIFINSPAVFAVMVGCFVSRIPVHVYEDKTQHGEQWWIEHGSEFSIRSLSASVSVASLNSGPSTTFENAYSPEKDRGVALVVTTRLSHKVTATVKFSQINLVAATASCLKHLPPKHELSKEDRILVLQQHTSAEAITNTVTKMLASFVSHAELYLCNDLSRGLQWSPTVISAPEKTIQDITKKPRGLQKLLFWHRLFALTQLKFSTRFASKPYRSLRLVYAYKSLDTPRHDYNRIRAALCAHVVEEVGYFNVAGPFLVTDMYDYRKVDESLSQNLVFRGSVVQAEEAKLADYDGLTAGIVCIRGHNFGRASTAMEGVGEKKIQPDPEGFYEIPKIKGKWGLDGCLYVSN